MSLKDTDHRLKSAPTIVLQISLTTQVTSVKTRFFLKNTGKQPSQFVDLCHLTEHTLKAAVFEVIIPMRWVW